MRHVLQGLGLFGLLLLTGCSNRDPRPIGGGVGGGGRQTRWDHQPTATSMVAYLNDNASRIQAVSCKDLTLDCKQGRESGVVSGRMDCEKPRNFRLTGRVVGQPMVDIGSNDQEFWYWISKAQPPYVYHCSHEALARGGVRMPFPFQPDMILTALGMGEYDRNKQYDVRANGNTVELIESTTSPQGQPLQKVTVFDKNARPGQPTVIAHILRDGNGHKICEATITHVIHDPSGAELPRRVALHWPDQQIELKMRLDDLRVVPPDPQLVQSLYSRRNLASHRSFDLERWAESQVQRVGDPPR